MCVSEPRNQDSESTSGEEEYAEEPESEYDEENQEIIRGKWMLDGCKTLDEVIERLEIVKQSIKEMKEEGWELEDKIDDDYGFMRRTAQS